MRLYSVIPGQLFVSGFPKEKDAAQLHEAGVTVVVGLSKKPTPPLEGLYVRRSPIPDGKTVSPELESIVAWVAGAVRGGENVLVHCLQGRNRSMLVALLAARELEGGSGEYWFQKGRWLRASCLHNPVFEAYLRSLA